MRLQPIAALMIMAGLLPALGCHISATGPAEGMGLWGPEMVAAPHPRFHAAPTRPVFAPSLVEFVEAAPPEAFHPAIPPELLEPPPSSGHAPSDPPADAPPADMLDGLPEPGILPPPETPLPRASSRRVPGMEYF